MSIEVIGYLATIVTCFIQVPQAAKVRISNVTAGLSSYAYILNIVSCVLWFVYALYLKNAPLLITEVFLAVTSGYILYKIIKNRAKRL